jgi:hypothetical protein
MRGHYGSGSQNPWPSDGTGLIEVSAGWRRARSVCRVRLDTRCRQATRTPLYRLRDRRTAPPHGDSTPFQHAGGSVTPARVFHHQPPKEISAMTNFLDMRCPKCGDQHRPLKFEEPELIMCASYLGQ